MPPQSAGGAQAAGADVMGGPELVPEAPEPALAPLPPIPSCPAEPPWPVPAAAPVEASSLGVVLLQPPVTIAAKIPMERRILAFTVSSRKLEDRRGPSALKDGLATSSIQRLRLALRFRQLLRQLAWPEEYAAPQAESIGM